jgi:hypothetical protein
MRGPKVENKGKPQTLCFRLFSIIIIGLATISLAWPSFVNKGPFFIADTTAYLRGADAAFSSILRYESVWSDKREIYASYRKNGEGKAQSELVNSRPVGARIHPPLIGRSIYYGAFIYFPALLFGEHVAVIVQAALSAVVIWLMLIPVGFTHRRKQLSAYALSIAVMVFATSLPFTTTLLVPDYLTGLGSASLVMLMCFWGAYNRWARIALGSIIVLAALSHSSNLPLLFALSLLGLLARIKVPLSAKAALIGFSAVALGVAGEAVFVSVVSEKIGISPIRPPFLTARLIADGPGHRLLISHCTIERFEVCRYSDRTPHDSDLFLWSEGPEGVFMAADLESQRKLSNQDFKFAVKTVRTFPISTLSSSFDAFVKQLFLIDLRIWKGGSGDEKFYDLDNLPDVVAARMAETLSAQDKMRIKLPQFIIRLSTIFSLIAGLYCLMYAWRTDNREVKAFGIALAFVILAVAMNAAITGGLSKPDARYNLRVIWLMPFFVLIFTFAAALTSRSRHPEVLEANKDVIV